jgi:phosphate transport system substrate-binding protein
MLHRMTRLRHILLFVLSLAFAIPSVAATDPLVVVVHPSNDIETISVEELRLIYMGRKGRWADGQKILVLNQPDNSENREKFYRLILGLDPGAQFFKPGSPAPFKTTTRKSDISVRRQVSRIQNVIGYMRLSNTSSRVKILNVTGFKADKKGRPLG